jgi:hypothetical protein
MMNRNLFILLILIILMIINANEVDKNHEKIISNDANEEMIEIEDTSEEYFAPNIEGEGIVLTDPNAVPIDLVPEDMEEESMVTPPNTPNTLETNEDKV